ncbi:MAG: hypothetical protein AUH13_26205 [Acidobacteria bacterium 13_2_20CM_58_27]|nr:MAG: hypothetical protein AUH13_26205 [Acidobacteria bacterium 13_2_20CM_58_27]
MKSNLRRMVRTAVVTLALAAGVALAPHQIKDWASGIVPRAPVVVEAAAPDSSARPCSVASIAGDWAFLTRAKTSGGVDGAGTGIFHLEKDGSSNFHGWSNVGGVFSEPSATGITTVEADCTGTQAWDSGGPTAKFVILRSGREIWAIYDGPNVVTVTLKRIGEP